MNLQQLGKPKSQGLQSTAMLCLDNSLGDDLGY
jgi:hypothetical protein